MHFINADVTTFCCWLMVKYNTDFHEEIIYSAEAFFPHVDPKHRMSIYWPNQMCSKQDPCYYLYLLQVQVATYILFPLARTNENSVPSFMWVNALFALTS